MEIRRHLLILFVVLGSALLLCACLETQPSPSITGGPTLAGSAVSPVNRRTITLSPLPASPTLVPATFTLTPRPPSPTPVPTQGKILLVNRTDVAGVGTLANALTFANPGDTIIFDPVVFPLDDPGRIELHTCLGALLQGSLTIDASQAGVILDGSVIKSKWCPGLTIASDHNTILGLRFENFKPGAGIELKSGNGVYLPGRKRAVKIESCRYNRIGGDQPGQGIQVTLGDIGVQFSGEYTSDNTIMASYIGVDPHGKLGLGNLDGVDILPNAKQNTIGPNNTIAFNRECGILFLDERTHGITISQNSIHDNGNGGICREGSSPGLIQPPVILEIDLEQRSVKGTACPGCLVEIFSDDQDQGAIYEGSTVAGEGGQFVFQKGQPLAGPHLTLTTTDAQGNTSQFSQPTSGSSKAIFQILNTHPIGQYPTMDSELLLENYIGGWFHFDKTETVDHARYAWDNANQLGYKWARITVEWPDWEEVLATGDYSILELPPAKKLLIQNLAEHDVKILFNLVFWDPEVRHSWVPSRYRDEKEIESFLRYVRIVATELKGLVTWYDLLNEPDNYNFGQHVAVEDYINLAKRVHAVIQEVDPQAGFAVGEVSSFTMGPQSLPYLMRILESDLMADVDVVTYHVGPEFSPLFFPTFYRKYPGWLDQMTKTASEHGFKGRFFVTESGWLTLELANEVDKYYYPDLIARKYIARGIMYHLSRGIAIGCCVRKSSANHITVRNMANLLSGAEPERLLVEVQSEAPDLLVFAFSLPDGDHLLAIYTNGIAREVDLGTPVTLTIPGISPDLVIAQDSIFGYQQELDFTIIDDNLVIENLLARDYPILIRLEVNANAHDLYALMGH